MGAEINDIVHEDETFGRLLEARDRAGLVSLIAERNAAYGTWGFKLPMLCEWLDADDMALFNDPHVIAVFRDPVAIVGARRAVGIPGRDAGVAAGGGRHGGNGWVRRAIALPQAVAEL